LTHPLLPVLLAFLSGVAVPQRIVTAQTSPAQPAALQQDAAPLQFNIASIHENRLAPTNPGNEPHSNVPLGPGNVYSPTGGLLMAADFPLITYISFAYKMTDYQLSSFEAAAPEWVMKDRFDIQARTDNTAVTKDGLRAMMRSLLKERFNFSAHYGMKELSVYALKLIKPGETGPKLLAHPTGSDCPSTLPVTPTDSSPPPSETIAGGFPATCGGLVLLPPSAAHLVHIGGRDLSLTLLANSLTSWGQLDHPVVDQTGLTGNIDFALEYAPERKVDPAATEDSLADPGGPTFRDALKRQLGLRLEIQKGDVPVVVLDHIDHLIPN
jgi:uncharacterized protein (TIGR03435 family)